MLQLILHLCGFSMDSVGTSLPLFCTGELHATGIFLLRLLDLPQQLLNFGLPSSYLTYLSQLRFGTACISYGAMFQVFYYSREQVKWWYKNWWVRAEDLNSEVNTAEEVNTAKSVLWCSWTSTLVTSFFFFFLILKSTTKPAKFIGQKQLLWKEILIADVYSVV